jgi:hypothetical protein
MAHEIGGGARFGGPPLGRSGGPVAARASGSVAVRRLVAATVWLVLLAGLLAALIVTSDRGDAEPFRIAQSRSLGLAPGTVLAAASVQAAVAQAPEPVVASKRTPPIRVRCRPGGPAPLRDPWSCLLRYRSGTTAHYRVEVQPDGYYAGSGTGLIDGCCIKTPSRD